MIQFIATNECHKLRIPNILTSFLVCNLAVNSPEKKFIPYISNYFIVTFDVICKRSNAISRILFTKFKQVMSLTLSVWAFFGLLMDGGQKFSPSLKSVTHILQWWNLAELHLTERRSKKCINHVTYPLSSSYINIFSPRISKLCYTKKYR